MFKLKRLIAGILVGVLVTGTTVQNVMPVIAAPVESQEETTNFSQEIEVLAVGKDITVVQGDETFDEETLEDITFRNDEEEVKLKEIKDKDNNPFNIHKPGEYQAVYTVMNIKSQSSYEVTRNIIVTEREQETMDASQGQNPETTTDSDDSEPEPESTLGTELETEQEITVINQSGENNSPDIQMISEEIESNEALMFSLDSRASSNVTVVVGERIKYPASLGQYSTFYFEVNGKVAYCLESHKAPPVTGGYVGDILDGNENLQKALYYGYGGGGDLTDSFMPQFDWQLKYIFTHIAASYFYAGLNAFTGCTMEDLEAAGVLSWISYLENAPSIPDPQLSLSSTSMAAYKNGDLQQTDAILLNGDSRNYITLNIPEDVTYHDSTGFSQMGGTVDIYGGTSFYFSASFNVTGDWNSGNMSGAIKNVWRTLVVKTYENAQDIGTGYYDDETSSPVSFNIHWMDIAKVEVIKIDSKTNNSLAGAIFGVFKDAECTDLITTMQATDAQGYSSVELTKTQDTVYVKEITAPSGYKYNATANNVQLKTNEAARVTVDNQMVTAGISLYKKDLETNTNKAQGDATLKGAVYAIYAKKDIVHPDGKTGILYKAGEKVAELVTNENGEAKITNLYLGEYYAKEIAAPVGYLLDPNTYEFDLSSADGSVAQIATSFTSLEQVKKQPFQIIKVKNNGNTDAELLKGAGFTAYLVSSLKVNSDGTYDFNSATPVILGKNGETEMFTDKNGHAVSVPLAYGTYIVRETTTPHNFKPVDDFIVNITEHKPTEPQIWRVLLDDEFEAKLKIIKQDDEKKKPVLLPNTEFKIYDVDNKKYVEQVTTYPTVVVHKSFFTDDSGTLILPQNLKIGNYRIEETSAPSGYTINKNHINIKVDSDTVYQVDPVSGDIIIEIIYENHPVKGELKIIKKGEVLSDYHDDFIYSIENLAGAEYEVFAADDIYTADFQRDSDGNRLKEFSKGELISSLVTNENGEAKLSNLPLGKYMITEKTAPENFVIKEGQFVEFVYIDQDTSVILEDATFINERQKVEVTVIKKDANDDSISGVSGAEFGLYSKNDIKVKDKVIVEANTLLCTALTGENGKALFEQDLPLPGEFYIKEIKAPLGYSSSDEVINVTATYQGQNIEVVELEFKFENKPTIFEFKKSDITTSVELDGATLSVLDKDKNVIETWTSVKGEDHVIKRLHVGETYILREEFAPYGYLKTTDIEFTVGDTGEVQKVEMKDDVPTGLILINKKGEFLEDITILDNIAGWIEHLFEYVTGSLEEVEFEIYALEDIKAADGESEDYYKKDDLIASITTNEKGIAKLDELPLGKYYVVEKQTQDGYVLDNESREIDLTYRDQDTKVVTFSSDWQNERQKVKITILKKEKNSEKVLEGAVFALYNKEDIVSASGKVLMKADNIIEQKATDKDGKLIFNADLPIGVSYYVKEIEPPAGYVSTDEINEFTFEYKGSDVDIVDFEFVYENEPTKVEISKVDIVDSEEIDGAKLYVLDENNKVMESWTSGTEKHLIERLPIGKYILLEEYAPKGYIISEKVPFEVKDTLEIQSVKMEDDRTLGKVILNKLDKDTKEALEGVEFELFDSDGKLLETMKTDSAGHAESKEYPIATFNNGRYSDQLIYKLRESKTADGYKIDSKEYEIKFEYVDDSTPIIEYNLEVENEKEKVQPSKQLINAPKTGDSNNLLMISSLMAISAITVGVIGYKKKKRK